MDIKIMKEKGFTYIIIVLIIMLFTTTLFLIAKNVSYSENRSDAVINNYINEINYLLENDFNEDTINSFNLHFKDYVKSNNYTSNFCLVVFDQNYAYLSNFQDENFSSIDDKETIKILKEDILENISFENCVLYTTDTENKIYFEISNDKEKKVYENNINIEYVLTEEPEDPETLMLEITSPLNNATFSYGEEISFTADVDNNTGDYTCFWSSSVDGNLEELCDFNVSSLSSGNHTITLSVTDDVNTETADVNITINFPQEYLDYLSLVSSDGGEIIDSNETLDLFNFLIDNNLYNNLVLGVSSSTGVKTRVSGTDLFVEKAYDFSENNNDALQTTNENQPKLESLGMMFDGNDDMLSSFVNTGQISSASIAFWLKRNGTQSSYAGLIFSRDGLSGISFDNTHKLYLHSKTGGWKVFNTFIPDNEYCFVVANFQSTTGTIYIYTQSTNYNETIAWNNSTLFEFANVLLANDTFNTIRRAKVNLNDVFIFNKALSPEEITLIYNQTKDKYQ